MIMIEIEQSSGRCGLASMCASVEPGIFGILETA
jgi:hypothetical protein